MTIKAQKKTRTVYRIVMDDKDANKLYAGLADALKILPINTPESNSIMKFRNTAPRPQPLA